MMNNIMNKMRDFWRSLEKKQTFFLGLVVGIIVGGSLIVFSLSLKFSNIYQRAFQDGMRMERVEAVEIRPTFPLIFRVIPEKALVGDEIIIRGGKFGSRGQVCFRLLKEGETSTCSHQFEVLIWTSGSIRAKISEIEKGEGALWVIIGDGGKSNEVNFVIE